MLFRSQFFLILGASLLFGGCLNNATPVNLTVDVKNSEGEAVPGALIRINDQDIGASDNVGRFRGEIDVELGAKVNIEISKQSDKFYYAPFYDSFTVGESDPRDLKPIKAVLYLVPKPTAQDVAKIEAEEPAATKEEIAAIPAQEEKLAATEPIAEETKIEVQASVTKLPAQTIAEKNEATPGVDEPLPELAKAEKPPEIQHQNSGASIFTVHVYSADQPVADALVHVGQPGNASLKLGCKTNARGRCVLRYKTMPEDLVNVVVSKSSFQTVTKEVHIKHMGQARFNLSRGDTIDILAISKVYNYVRGVENVDVWIQGKLAGKTDRFGHFYYVYPGRKSDLLEVQLKTRNFMPEDYTTDFVVSGPMSLVRYFSPAKPPAVKMTLLKLQPAGRLGPSSTVAFDGFIDTQLKRATDKHLFGTKVFTEFPLTSFRKSADAHDLSLASMIRKGWDNTEIKSALDVVLLPTLIIGGSNVLEISVINSRGQVVAAAKETLDNAKDAESIDRAVATIAKSIGRVFPFEGGVLGVDGKSVTINLGFGSGRAVKVGDEVDVLGAQAEEYGRTQTQKNVATLVVKEVLDEMSRCEVKRLAPRASIHRGDVVIVRPQRSSTEQAPSLAQIRVLGGENSSNLSPLSQANVYFNERWIGATDSAGKLAPSNKMKGQKGFLKVIKHGYRDFVRETTFTSNMNLELSLERELAFLRVESNPSGAVIRIEGKEVGKTPLATPLAVPSGFVKLEIVGPPGYKSYETVLDLAEGTVELTDANKIELQKDFRVAARDLVTAGKYKEALAKLREVPKTHADFLLAAHDRGEIYLNQLKQPALAAQAFGKVTSNALVKNFNDKRFIGTHINEGIALFMTAENLQKKEPEAATAHYLKAIETLDKVSPYLRFVSKDQYAHAVHNLEYYKALSQHRLYNQTKNPSYLTEAFKSWRSYVETNNSEKDEKGQDKAFLENARVYMKQAESTLAVIGSEPNATAN